MHIGRELPQFRLGALSAARQALREEKRMARKAAKASGRQARSERTTSGRQARGKEWLDFFAAWRLCERKEIRDKKQETRSKKRDSISW